MKTRRRLTVFTALQMQNAMSARPHTYNELVAIADLGREAVERWVRQMRAAKSAHVAAWLRDETNGQHIAAFAWGPGVDQPRPAGLSPAELKAQWRKRKGIR